MKEGGILRLFRSKNTVFSAKDISLILEESNVGNLFTKIHYYVNKGYLYRVRKGMYAKDKNYDKFEVAVKIYTPSYISFETVLGRAGVTFQFYGQIFVASYLTREIIADGQTYSYKKIKNSILTNHAGVETKGNYFIASPERAFLDIVYLSKGYHFDNLSPINWGKVSEILPIYSNKRMEKKVKEYRKSMNGSQ